MSGHGTTQGGSSPYDDRFSVGDEVIVSWMGNAVRATIWRVELASYHRRPLKEPQYRVAIGGVAAHPYYAHHEIERAE